MNFGFPNGIAIKPSAARESSNKSSPIRKVHLVSIFPISIKRLSQEGPKQESDLDLCEFIGPNAVGTM